MNLDLSDRLIVAVDEGEPALARRMVARLAGAVRWIKIGMTLYYRTGPGFVKDLQQRGFRVFVDLKCHDIPSQVAGAVTALADLGADLVTIHTPGGLAMLEAAQRAVEGTTTRLLGVTVLTSLGPDELEAVGADCSPRGLVRRRSLLAVEAGLAGVIASPLEAAAVREIVPPDFEIVTPGIRPLGSALNDQRRYALPADAIRAGASRLVVGRPITRAKDPAAAARAVLEQMSAGLAEGA